MSKHMPEILTRLIDPEQWESARWSATTFRWHPTSEAPPIMGLVFDEARTGKQIFTGWRKLLNHFVDEFEQIRVSIIDGTRPEGHFVHICPDPGNVTAKATTEDLVVAPVLVFVSRLNWMRRVPGTPDLLGPFQREYRKHKEYLLAPVTRRADGQYWVDVDQGIIKRDITFRHISEVGTDDMDAIVLHANLNDDDGRYGSGMTPLPRDRIM